MPTRTAETMRADLVEVRDRIVDSKADIGQLLDRRALLVRSLSAAGVRRADIAVDAGVSLHMVKLILSGKSTT